MANFVSAGNRKHILFNERWQETLFPFVYFLSEDDR